GTGVAGGGDGGVAEDGLAGAALELVQAILELVQHRPASVERPPGPGQLRIGQDPGAAVGVVLRERLGTGGHRHAVADLAQEGGGEPVAIVPLAVAAFQARIPHPQLVAPGDAAGHGHVVLGQRPAVAHAAGLDRLRRVDHQRRVAGFVEGAAGIHANVEAPALVDHEPLVQPEQGEGARAVLADPALVERAGQGSILPRARLEAHARGGGIAILAVGELLGGKEPQLVVDLERGVDLHPGGEVDAVVLAAEAHFGLRTQLQPAVHEEPARAQRDLPRFGDLALRRLVAGHLQPGVGAPAIGAIAGFQGPHLPLEATRQVFLAIDLPLQAEIVAQAVLPLHAGLEHPRFETVLLAQAEARPLPARVYEEVQRLAAVFPFHQPGAAFGVALAAVDATGGRFGAEFVVRRQAELRIDAGKLAARLRVLVADVARACFQAAIHRPDADAGAAVEELLAGALGFVLGDDPDRIEVEVPARDRLAEQQRAVLVVDVVVDVADHLARVEDLLAVVAVAGLDADPFAVHHDPALLQAVKARGAVAL